MPLMSFSYLTALVTISLHHWIEAVRMDILVLFLILGRTEKFKRKMPIVSLVGRKPEPMMWLQTQSNLLSKYFWKLVNLCEDAQGTQCSETLEKELTLCHMNQVIPSLPSPQQCEHNRKPPSLWPTQHPAWSTRIIRGSFYMCFL